MQYLNSVHLRGVVGTTRVSEVFGKKLIHFSLATNFIETAINEAPVITTNWHNVSYWAAEGDALLNLAAELAAAVVAGRLGMSSTLSQSSLQYLKEWSRILSDDPSVIRQVVRKSRLAVRQMLDALGITQDTSEHLCGALKAQIAKAQESAPSARYANRKVYSGRNGRTGKPCIQRRSAVDC